MQHGEELNRGELAGTLVTTTLIDPEGGVEEEEVEEQIQRRREGERGLGSKYVPTYLVEVMSSSSSLDAWR